MKKSLYVVPSLDIVCTVPSARLLIGSDPVLNMLGTTDNIGGDVSGD